jgi:RimJ/RimL family protein N-acetyltransferase
MGTGQPPMMIAPVLLEGFHVRLEPLAMTHVPGLCKVGLDDDLWKITMTLIRSEEEMKQYVETALRLQEMGTAVAFATVDKKSGRIAGSTRFGNIDKNNKRVEIGWTWLGKEFQRTHVNTEAKYLMLKHAFEVWGCYRVEFKTDVINEKSRNALKRIGAKEEGILRKHQITSTGRVRDSVYYSILDDEWVDAKAQLEKRMLRQGEITSFFGCAG